MTTSRVLLASQVDHTQEDPASGDIYRVGVLANVLQLLKLPDGTVKVLVEGQRRVRITEFTREDGYFEALVAEMPDTAGP